MNRNNHGVSPGFSSLDVPPIDELTAIEPWPSVSKTTNEKVEIVLTLDDSTRDFLQQVVDLAGETLDTVVGVMLAAHVVRTERDAPAENNDPGAYADVTAGTWWQHRNGNKYEVLFLANVAVERKGHEVTVVYRGENGNLWARPLSDWSRSMMVLGYRKAKPDSPPPSRRPTMGEIGGLIYKSTDCLQ